MPSLLAATASVGELECNSPTLAVAASKLDIYPMLCVCVVFELLMMGGETA